ncbi:MAG: amidohydrolase [Firmicutes bacterium]|nr:amidohydrolase [Bacillota bacterium]
MSSIDILITGASWLLTMDSKRRILKDGAVAIQGNRIVDVGKTPDLLPKYPNPKETIDARGRLVMPGLVNGHFHSTQQLARGLADNVFAPTWIHDRAYPYEAACTSDDVYLASLCSCLEAIKTGTTCFADPGGYHMDRAAQAVEETGIRAVLSRSMVDIHTAGRPIPGKMREDTRAALDGGEEFVSRYHGAAGGRIRAWFSLRTERMVSDDLCLRTKELAGKYKTGVESHNSSVYDSVLRHKEIHHGLRPVERYYKIGLLGPNVLLYHMNWLTDAEVDMLQETDTKITHCPTAAFMGGYGTLQSKHVDMLHRGITVCLGSDNGLESNFNDMFKVMYCATAHRDYRQDATLLPPEQLLEMTVTNGYRACLWDDECGTLEPGKKADLIILETSGPEWIPIHNPVSNLVHAADGHSVRTSVIDGKVVMKEGRILTVDEDEILARAQTAALDIARRSGLEVFGQPKWPVV